MRRFLFLIVVMVGVLMTSAVDAARTRLGFRVVDLGHLGQYRTLLAINDRGFIATSRDKNHGLGNEPIMSYLGRPWESLSGFPNGEGAVWDINNDNVVVGFTGNDAFVWKSGRYERLPLGDTVYSSASSISQNGYITGSLSRGFGSPLQAFLYHPRHGLTLLTQGQGLGVNRYGVVVGSTNRPVSGSVPIYSIMRISARGLEQYSQGHANAVNSRGTMVGATFRPSFTFAPFRQTVRGETEELGYLDPDWTDGHANAINDHEQVVGQSGASGFLWMPEARMLDLNDLLVDAPSWQISSASDINNAGQIVGTGRYMGEFRAVLLLPVRRR